MVQGRRQIYKVLLAGVLIPLAACASNPNISDQKNSVQASLGPIFNAINNSHQDGSTPFKPFQGIFSNLGGQHHNQQGGNSQNKNSASLLGPINVQHNYQQNQVPALKQTPPPPVTPTSLQPNYVSIVQPVTTQIKQPPQPLQPTISLQPALGQTGPTPVILQYLSQGHLPGPVQYLQLIPTRPLIVPISPYLAQVPNYQFHQKIGQTNYNPKANSINDQIPAASRTSPGSIVGGYVNNSPSFRFFRPNSGMEVINPPPDLSLNTNEYIPEAVANLNKISPGRL